MAHEQLNYDDLLRIVELIKSSEQFSEFRLKVGDIEVEIRRRTAPGARSPTPGLESKPEPAAVPAVPTSGEASLQPDTSPSWPEGAHVVRSPMVGTFYRAPEPGGKPFVEVGQKVEPLTIVCIVEVMKLMNSVPAGVKGTVIQVRVGDAASVQAGQPLIVVQPD